MPTPIRVSPTVIAVLTMLTTTSIYGVALAAFLTLPGWLRALSAALIEIRADWKRPAVEAQPHPLSAAIADG